MPYPSLAAFSTYALFVQLFRWRAALSLVLSYGEVVPLWPAKNREYSKYPCSPLRSAKSRGGSKYPYTLESLESSLFCEESGVLLLTSPLCEESGRVEVSIHS